MEEFIKTIKEFGIAVKEDKKKGLIKVDYIIGIPKIYDIYTLDKYKGKTKEFAISEIFDLLLRLELYVEEEKEKLKEYVNIIKNKQKINR